MSVCPLIHQLARRDAGEIRKLLVAAFLEPHTPPPHAVTPSRPLGHERVQVRWTVVPIGTVRELVLNLYWDRHDPSNEGWAWGLSHVCTRATSFGAHNLHTTGTMIDSGPLDDACEVADLAKRVRAGLDIIDALVAREANG